MPQNVRNSSTMGNPMLTKFMLPQVFVLCFAFACFGQDAAESKPPELQILKESIGVWDADIEVWPQGLDSPSITFKGVETNRAYGDHWLASDFDSEFMGQSMKAHTIIGYDLDQKKLVGTIIDQGPYSATMTGEFDPQSRIVVWKTEAKHPNGEPMIQRTTVNHKTATERVLVLAVPGEEQDTWNKFMEVRFTKRK